MINKVSIILPLSVISLSFYTTLFSVAIDDPKDFLPKYEIINKLISLLRKYKINDHYRFLYVSTFTTIWNIINSINIIRNVKFKTRFISFTSSVLFYLIGGFPRSLVVPYLITKSISSPDGIEFLPKTSSDGS